MYHVHKNYTKATTLEDSCQRTQSYPNVLNYKQSVHKISRQHVAVYQYFQPYNASKTLHIYFKVTVEETYIKRSYLSYALTPGQMCFFSADDHASLREHMDVFHGVSRWLCVYCEQFCRLREQMRDHMRKVHLYEPNV
jgi:hypothetical protein